MDKKAHEALERIRKDVTLNDNPDMENQDAAEFFNETGRLGVCQWGGHADRR